jgi:MoaA/NifB/PqqE/SkfB family radical SAM enzyme
LGYRSITVDTNGYLFHDFLARVSPQTLDFISFSLDGASAETNDALRGKGSFKHCIGGIKAAVDRGFNVSLIYTVSRMNIDEIKVIPRLLEGLKIDRFFIQVIGIRGQSAKEQASSWQVSSEEWRAVIPALAQKVANLGIRVTYPKVYLEEGDRFACAGRSGGNYFVFPNGRVYQCPLCEDFPLHSYTIDDQGLTKTPPINEVDLFQLEIPEGCVMNRLIQPQTIRYRSSGRPEHRIACCLLKEETCGVVH